MIACTKTCSALDTAKLFLANVWKHHGLPRSISSDQGPQFVAQVMQELNKALGIATKLLTSFHLQTDGQTEIVNKEIGKFLRIYCFEKQDSWFAWLPIAQFSINTKKHTLTKKSPFDVTWSYLPRMGIEPISLDRAPAAQKFASEMEDVIESVKNNMKQAQDRMKVNTDTNCSAVPSIPLASKSGCPQKVYV